MKAALTSEKARANPHRIEAGLDRALQSGRLGPTLGEVGIDFCGVGQTVRDNAVESEMSIAGSLDIWAKGNRVGNHTQTNSAAIVSSRQSTVSAK